MIKSIYFMFFVCACLFGLFACSAKAQDKFKNLSSDDYEAFTKQVYLSVPLKNYLQLLRKGDKIRFNLNTYKEGETYREFDYQ